MFWYFIEKRRFSHKPELMGAEFAFVRKRNINANVVRPHLKTQTNPQKRNSKIKNFSIKRRVFISGSRAAGENNSYWRELLYISRFNFDLGRSEEHTSEL